MSAPADPVIQAVGATLRAARIRLRLTQAQVAEAIELSPEPYARIERGQQGLSVQTLYRACLYLGVSADEALQLPEEAPPVPPSPAARASPPGPTTEVLDRLTRRARALSPRSLRVMAAVARNLK